MKSLRKVLVTIIAVTFVLSMAMSTVKALPATDLKSLKVYSVDTAGTKKKIKFKFNPTTYKYDLVVKSNVPRIEVIPVAGDATSTAVVDKEQLNTRMDTGMNTTTVTVTSSTGAKQVYTLKTKKLTPAEDANYKDDDTKTTKKTKKSAKIDIDGKEYKITSFKKKDIPRGFVATTAKYKGKKYDAIKGKEKDLTAFYLEGEDGNKFFIYNKDTDKFYPMNNVKVRSRMYTIVEPEKTDDILKNYETKNIKIDGQKTKVWILDEEKGLYFVYAMNWDGDTSLYTYDDQEKCMQRYLVDNDVNAQIEAANQAYDNMKDKRNAMAKKYNIFRYIIIGMAVIIIILIFILIHRGLNRKEKKVKEEEFITAGMGGGPKPDEEVKEEVADPDDIDAPTEEADEDDIDVVPEEETEDDAAEEEPVVDVAEVESIMEENEAEADDDDDIEFIDIDDLDDDDDAPEFEEPEAEEVPAEEPKTEEPVIETPIEPVQEPEVEPTPEETHEKKRAFGKAQRHEGYGDEPTFGTEKESSEGFYGGEVKDEQDVLVDITEDDEPELADPIEDMVAEKEIQDTADIDVDSINEPEDLKSTLKSMLGSDDDEEDDDFEFIDLN